MASDRDILFYVVFISALAITRVPVVGKYFRVVNTLLHESGHALVALVTSARVVSVELFSNTAGTATTQARNKLAGILIALAGYPASAASGFLFFYLIDHGNQKIILYILASLSLFHLIFFVRNSYGIFWLITFCFLTVLMIYFNHFLMIFLAAVFFSAIILTDSLISVVQVVVLSIRKPGAAGDASNLRQSTHIPAFFWALIFVALVICFTWKALHYFPMMASFVK